MVVPSPFFCSSETGRTIKGEIDFFVNGNLMWGIELLKQGTGVGEHIARFGRNGKYSLLKARQFIIVDFLPMVRGRRTGVQRIAPFRSNDGPVSRSHSCTMLPRG